MRENEPPWWTPPVPERDHWSGGGGNPWLSPTVPARRRNHRPANAQAPGRTSRLALTHTGWGQHPCDLHQSTGALATRRSYRHANMPGSTRDTDLYRVIHELTSNDIVIRINKRHLDCTTNWGKLRTKYGNTVIQVQYMGDTSLGIKRFLLYKLRRLQIARLQMIRVVTIRGAQNVRQRRTMGLLNDAVYARPSTRAQIARGLGLRDMARLYKIAKRIKGRFASLIRARAVNNLARHKYGCSTTKQFVVRVSYDTGLTARDVRNVATASCAPAGTLSSDDIEYLAGQIRVINVRPRSVVKVLANSQRMVDMYQHKTARE